MNHPASILYVMGGGLGDMKDIRQAVVLAKESHASLTLLDVVESLPPSARMLVTAIPSGEIKGRVLARRQDQLEALLSMIRPDAVDMRIQMRFGNRAREIVSEAADGGYDVVIKHPEKGRTDKHLLRNSVCPVQLLKHDDYLASGQSLVSRISHFAGKGKKLRDEIGIRTGAQFFAG